MTNDQLKAVHNWMERNGATNWKWHKKISDYACSCGKHVELSKTLSVLNFHLKEANHTCTTAKDQHEIFKMLVETNLFEKFECFAWDVFFRTATKWTMNESSAFKVWLWLDLSRIPELLAEALDKGVVR